MKKDFFILIIIFVAVATTLFIILGTTSPPLGNDELLIQNQFDGKIVYTVDMSLDQTPFKTDCQKRGGTFKPCGTPCAPDAEICPGVCAYVCLLQ